MESFSDQQISFCQQRQTENAKGDSLNGEKGSGLNTGLSQAFLGVNPINLGSRTMVSTTSTPTPTSSTSSFYLLRNNPRKYAFYYC